MQTRPGPRIKASTTNVQALPLLPVEDGHKRIAAAAPPIGQPSNNKKHKPNPLTEARIKSEYDLDLLCKSASADALAQLVRENKLDSAQHVCVLEYIIAAVTQSLRESPLPSRKSHRSKEQIEAQRRAQVKIRALAAARSLHPHFEHLMHAAKSASAQPLKAAAAPALTPLPPLHPSTAISETPMQSNSAAASTNAAPVSTNSASANAASTSSAFMNVASTNDVSTNSASTNDASASASGSASASASVEQRATDGQLVDEDTTANEKAKATTEKPKECIAIEDDRDEDQEDIRLRILEKHLNLIRGPGRRSSMSPIVQNHILKWLMKYNGDLKIAEKHIDDIA